MVFRWLKAKFPHLFPLYRSAPGLIIPRSLESRKYPELFFCVRVHFYVKGLHEGTVMWHMDRDLIPLESTIGESGSSSLLWLYKRWNPLCGFFLLYKLTSPLGSGQWVKIFCYEFLQTSVLQHNRWPLIGMWRVFSVSLTYYFLHLVHSITYM